MLSSSYVSLVKWFVAQICENERMLINLFPVWNKLYQSNVLCLSEKKKRKKKSHLVRPRSVLSHAWVNFFLLKSASLNLVVLYQSIAISAQHLNPLELPWFSNQKQHLPNYLFDLWSYWEDYLSWKKTLCINYIQQLGVRWLWWMKGSLCERPWNFVNL